MTMTHSTTEATTKFRELKESPLGLLIAVIRERPNQGKEAHKAAFRKLITSAGYEDFIEAVIDEWQAIKYSTAFRAANPPSIQEIREKTQKRINRRKERLATIEKAKTLIQGNLLDLTMPNGKKLRDCTGADCAHFSGWQGRIAAKVKPTQKVGKVLNESAVRAIYLEGQR
jgi:hypothetical protein